MTFDDLRLLAKYLLSNRLKFQDDWTTQGFGFLRLRVAENLRLHVWDSQLRVAGVSDIHDHAQWAFTSTILSGHLVNLRFSVANGNEEVGGDEYNMAEIKCGVGGGMTNAPISPVRLVPGRPELYMPGLSYHQEPGEVHRSMPADGAVTLIKQERRETETARVFWPKGGAWGDAFPRPATRDEVDMVGHRALTMFG